MNYPDPFNMKRIELNSEEYIWEMYLDEKACSKNLRAELESLKAEYGPPKREDRLP